MTYSFSIPKAYPKLAQEILDDPKFAELRIIFEHESKEHFLLACPERSTRGFELHYEHGNWNVSLRFLAAPADWIWALRCVKALALANQAAQGNQADQSSDQIMLIAEHQPPTAFSVAQLSELSSPEWLQDKLLHGLTDFLSLAHQKDALIPLMGWAGAVYFGANILNVLELDVQTPPEEAFVVLVDYLRSVQQVLYQEHYQPKVQKAEGFKTPEPKTEAMVMKLLAGEPVPEEISEPVSEVHLAILPENLTTLVNTLNYEALGLWPEAQEEPTWFPIGRFAELFAEVLSPLDEVQYLVKPISDTLLETTLAKLKSIYAAKKKPADYAGLEMFFKGTEEVEIKSPSENPKHQSFQ